MQQVILLSLVYVMFFLSGAAALMYQVVWVRSLSLIFGGTHLAVTAVLSIFMAGLALGGYVIGKYVDRSIRPLRLYGILEIGIALFAVVFAGLMKIYPSLYISLARGKDDAIIVLTLIRFLFAFIALIIPTTLMGGTLPVLSRFLSRQPEKIRGHLSLLYGINTLGAVLGAAAAGFFLLRLFSVSFTLQAAVIMNLLIGITSILLQRWGGRILAPAEKMTEMIRSAKRREPSEERVKAAAGTGAPLPLKLVLWGIGISGFCALGYEVLWTRVLALVAGASVYSFTTMLVAFLTGIALGSKAFGVLPHILGSRKQTQARSVAWFGIVQIIIGVSALLVSIFIRDLPFHTVRLREFVMQYQSDIFTARLLVNFMVAYLYMLVPSFFMGVAFPLAGNIHAHYRQKIGLAVGEILAYNTIGAILGAAASGFLLIYLFGMERALQILVTINIGYGIVVLASLRPSRVLPLAALAGTSAMLLFLMFNTTGLRLWNSSYFAIYRNNDPVAFRSPAKFKEALDNTDILYYQEGIEAVISSVKIKGEGGIQALLVNSKVVADTDSSGIQCQYTLGHLPMLLHNKPEKVLVVGLGTGMTLGATSIHPSVREITLAEIEPKVMGGARTFAAYNHQVLDNPKLTVVFNDGRNFLMTTGKKFDVITADPIHPWAQGASYLYTVEYFTMAAKRLQPGGIMCQWLPAYELSTADLQAVVKTFSQSFKYTMLWLTHHDAELIGSNEPIIIDEAELDRRIAAAPAVAADLQQVQMGSAADFMSYFVLGSKGLDDFARGGMINTDDNLYLEFSSPISIARTVMSDNLNAIHSHLESIYPYLRQPEEPEQRHALQEKWQRYYKAARVAIKGQALMTGQLFNTNEFRFLLDVLETRYPFFARGKFLHSEYREEMARMPHLIDKASFAFIDRHGQRKTVEIAAVIAPISKTRANILLLNNAERIIYGQQLITGKNLEEQAQAIAHERLTDLQNLYRQKAEQTADRQAALPRFDTTMEQLKATIAISMPAT